MRARAAWLNGSHSLELLPSLNLDTDPTPPPTKQKLIKSLILNTLLTYKIPPKTDTKSMHLITTLILQILFRKFNPQEWSSCSVTDEATAIRSSRFGMWFINMQREKSLWPAITTQLHPRSRWWLKLSPFCKCFSSPSSFAAIPSASHLVLKPQNLLRHSRPHPGFTDLWCFSWAIMSSKAL